MLRCSQYNALSLLSECTIMSVITTVDTGVVYTILLSTAWPKHRYCDQC